MKHLKFFVFLCILTFTVSCGQQKKYIEYKVKEGESLRSIAKKLDIKTKDLLRLNPDIARKPKANTVIIIPNLKTKTATSVASGTKNGAIPNKALDSVNNGSLPSGKEIENGLLSNNLENEFQLHSVIKGDTFYSLTRFYKVSRASLIQLNPELESGLKLGQTIKIKRLPKVKVKENVNLPKYFVDNIKEDVFLNVAVMLPFRAQELDTLSRKQIFENSKLANIVSDLYLGLELAVDSLRKQGVTIDVTVFDTGRNSTSIKNIIAANDLNENNLIIGPLYSEEVQMLANQVKIPIVFPVYSKKQTNFKSKYIIKTAPEKKLYRDKLTSYATENFKDGNVIIVGDGSALSKRHALALKTGLEEKDSIKGVNLITAEKGYIKREKFTDVLKANEQNRVILTTEDPIIVASAINSLISLEEDVTARVFTFDKNSALNKIDNLKLAKLNFTFVSDAYSKSEAAEVIDFNSKYLSKNGVLPSYYATKGFDITYDILMRLASGKELKHTFSEGVSYRVQSKFDYEGKLLKATENKGLFMVKFNADLTLSTLD